MFKKSKEIITNDKPKNEILLGFKGRKQVTSPIDASHFFVCGTTGSGKTVALSNFIKTVTDYKYPTLIIDGKGDTGNGSLLDIVKKLHGNQKVYVVDLIHPDMSDKYNPFQNTSPTTVKDMLINLTVWSEPHYKLNMERYLQRTIDMMALAERPINFKSIIKSLEISEFLTISANLSKDKRITKDEHIANVDLTKKCEKIVDGAIARFSNIVESEVGIIFDEDGIDIYTALRENAIILFILNPLKFPELSPLFGNMVVIDSKKAVSNLYDNPLKRTFFIFDEINVYASKSFLDLVNKSRSANVTCVLASQSLSDLESAESESFREQVIENCNNYLILRQNSATNAELWSAIVGTRETVETTRQINKDGETGAGSIRRTREYILHPDVIKEFGKGMGFFVSKDQKIKTKISIHKPF